MATFSQPAKNDLTITNDSTKATLIWDEADFSWDDAGGGTWDNPKIGLKKETKNNITLTNDSQS